MARILLVDDNTDMLEMLRMVLERKGNHEVLLSTNGRDGLNKALTERPDLAIIDVMMPIMNGYDVVKELRAHRETAGINIIILTARGQPVDAEAALKAGANLHMSKPVDAKALLTSIEKLLLTEKPRANALLSIISLRGGLGATTIAVNLAVLLQQIDKTFLLDLSPNSGHCALYLGLKPTRHWGLLLQRPDIVINAHLFEKLTLKHTCGLQLLAAPPSPLQNNAFLSPNQLAAIMKGAEEQTHFTIVDMPPLLNSAALKLLDDANHIILLSDDDPPGIQTTARTLQALNSNREKTTVVVNHVRPGPRPPAQAVQRTLRVPNLLRIPYDATQTTATRRGIPSVLSGAQSPLIPALQQLAQRILK